MGKSIEPGLTIPLALNTPEYFQLAEAQNLICGSKQFVVFAAFAWGDTVTTAWEDAKAPGISMDVRAEVEELLAEFKICDEATVDAATSYVTEALAEGGSNAEAEVDPDKTTFKHIMKAGDMVVDSSGLSGPCKQDMDIYVFIFRGAGTWYMEIIDCCLMGDTMLGAGKVVGVPVKGWATSPTIVTLGPVPNPAGGGFGIVIVCYLKCPGGFPAGYDANAWY